MDFDTLLKNRKSSRKFTGKKVSFRSLMDAIDAALQGPFPDNHNHLKFLIIEDKEKIKEISSYSEQNWIATAPAIIAVCSDDSHLENLYGPRGRVYSRQTAGAAINAILLKLTELNLGSCWVGAYTDKKIKNLLSIPEDIQIEAIIPVGYSDDDKRKMKKPSLDKSIYWEKWKIPRRTTFFEETMEDYGH